MPERLKLRQWKGRGSTVSEMTLPCAIDQTIPPDPITDLSRKPPREVHGCSNVSIRPKPDTPHSKTWSTQLTTGHPQMMGIVIGKKVDGLHYDRTVESQPSEQVILACSTDSKRIPRAAIGNDLDPLIYAHIAWDTERI